MTKIKIAALALFALLVSGVLPIACTWSPARAPEQPIAFNHRVHTVERKIDCSNCHEYYNQHSVAGIPSIKICYTCHSGVHSDKPEVKKIFAYYEKKQEIPWVRLYQMPNHVVFNHKRHVKAGLKCSDCHGNIGESTSPRRDVDHTMGSCMKCHEAKKASLDCLTCHK